MQTHRNAKLGLSGRFALVQAREAGLSVREVARRFSVSPATVSRWSCRWRRASAEERATLGCLFDRSSRPRRMPRLLPALEQRQICAARRRTGWGPRLLTVATGRPHSTISKVLKRHGLSRPERAAREPVRRYEWPCPGDLLHSDWTLYARFDRPGHAVTGDRSKTAAEKKARLGYQFAHAIVDDHSRLGYAELLADCRAATVTAFTSDTCEVRGGRHNELMEPPISHRDVTTTMALLGDIKSDVRSIRLLLEDEDGGEEEAEAREPDA
jgi:transposase